MLGNVIPVAHVLLSMCLQYFFQNNVTRVLIESKTMMNFAAMLKTNFSSTRLYNKDAIIEYLLDKSAERPNAEVVAHIRSIKVSKLWQMIIVL